MAPEQGTVLRSHSGSYLVLTTGGTLVPCRARRNLRRADPSWPEFPVPGDEVEWKPLGAGDVPGEGIIEAVRPRRSEIARQRSGAKHVVVANIDQLVVVMAVREPVLDRGLLDRLLATAERNRLAACVCLHKADLAPAEEYEPARRVYERAGYAVLCTSAVSGAGLQELRQRLCGSVGVFMGASGAGKSHLISALQPGLKLRTGMVSQRTGLGQHTTTRVDLHRTDFGALLADTPGVREFSLWRLAPEELGNLFPEFRRVQGGCRFAGCMHVPEPGCAVKLEVEAGDIDAGRHRSYQAILEDLRQGASDPGPTRRQKRVPRKERSP